MKEVKNLPEQFIGIGEVKGFVFTKIKESDKAFIYEVDCGCSKNHYEVFKKKAKTNSILYCYPTSKAFGDWAWSTANRENALEIFKNLNNKRT